MEQIFLSYSRKNSFVADTLDEMFSEKNIILIRDVRDIKYKDSIKQFMKRVRTTDYVLIIITEEYLKSTSCMYEITEFLKDEDYEKRILPLINMDTDIFDIKVRNKFIKYWQDKYMEIQEEEASLDILNRAELIDELRKIKEIQMKLPEFLKAISDMELIKFKTNITLSDFNKIYCYLGHEETMLPNIMSQDGYFLLNVARTLSARNLSESKTMIWWNYNNKGYTDDLKYAKIFSQEDLNDILNDKRGQKKYAAVPIKVALEFKQVVVPFYGRFYDILYNNREKILGNKELYLSEDEVKIYC